MKRVFGIIFGLFLGTSCCFAEPLWHFRSGDSEVGYPTSTEVRNYSGLAVTVNRLTLPNGEKRKIYGSDIFISIDNVERPKAYYTTGGDTLIITIPPLIITI